MNVASLSEARQPVSACKILSNAFLIVSFFLMMPLIIPMSIAAQSIVGEKQYKSLEPLLATPIKTGELLFAKALRT